MPPITSKTEELTGVFVEEKVSRGADDSLDRWVVGKLKGRKTIVGNAAKGRLVPGSVYRFLGSWNTDARFGKQFKFSSFIELEPADVESIQRYLTQAPGIGPVTAARIVGHYGQDALTACRERTVEVGQKCGVPDEVMIELAKVLKNRKAREGITIDLDSLLHGGGFPRTLAQKLIEEWGQNACEKIRENPFVLREFAGVGFSRCDALYQRLGLPMDAMTRQVHCVLYAVESDLTGSTWVHREMILHLLRTKLAGATPQPDRAIEEAIEQEMIVERDGYYATTKNANNEDDMVNCLVAATAEAVDEFGF